MAFDGTEGGWIDESTASDWTANYRTANPGAVKAHFIGKDYIETLLAQNDSMGLRIYYAEDAEEEKHLIIVAAKSNEDDNLKKIANYTVPCPTTCGVNNALNS